MEFLDLKGKTTVSFGKEVDGVNVGLLHVGRAMVTQDGFGDRFNLSPAAVSAAIAAIAVAEALPKQTRFVRSWEEGPRGFDIH